MAHPLSQRCEATSKRSGHRCRRWAILGGSVCIMHGGRAGQVRARAAAKVAAWEASQAGGPTEPRDAGETLLAACAEADKLMQRMSAAVYRGDVNAAMLAGFGDAIDRAARIGKMIVDARLDERAVRLQEQRERMHKDYGGQVAGLVREVVTDVARRMVGAGSPLPDGFAGLVMAAIRDQFERMVAGEIGELAHGWDAETDPEWRDLLAGRPALPASAGDVAGEAAWPA